MNYADFVFPLAIERSHSADLALVNTTLAPAQAKVSLAADALAGLQAIPWPSGAANLTGGRPGVLASESPAVVAQPGPDGVCELPAPPIVASARFATAKATGVFKLPVTPGEKLRVEITADRLGLPVDAVLNVEKEKGGSLGSNDDHAGSKDPAVEFTVPEGTNKIVIRTHDLYGAGGDDHLYRLSVTPVGKPDFKLSLEHDTLETAPGRASLVRVTAERAGYAGPIKLTALGLPSGWTLAPSEIPAGADQALVSLIAAADAPAGGLGVGSIRGESVGLDPPVSREAMAPDAPAYRLQPWLRRELAVGAKAAGPIELVWSDWNETASLAAGAKAPIKVEIKRAAGIVGPVRVTLETTQSVPKKTVKEKNVDKSVEATERALRLAAPIEIAADQTIGSGELIVPGDLPPHVYDLALRGELLSGDKKTVVTTADSAPRRATSVAAMTLELAGPAEVMGRAGLGDAGQLTGKVTRAAGFRAPIKVQLAGLPKDTPSPVVTLEGEAVDFSLPLSFRFGAATGPVADAKLVALSSPDAQNPAIEARSNEVAIKLTIAPGEKPPANPALVIFEDQPEFIAALTEGDGMATLDTEQKYSGIASCQVTPSQRFNPNLPGLDVKIRERPAAGEYRYLRFAWLKSGGEKICFQLNHDGQWGPIGNKPAKFRYHAGAQECFGASLKVADQLPVEFTIVTRDLFADFGEFTLKGIALSPVDGNFALFDHIELGQTMDDFESGKAAPAKKP